MTETTNESSREMLQDSNNLVEIENNNRNHKIYPFQDFDEFTPSISDG